MMLLNLHKRMVLERGKNYPRHIWGSIATRNKIPTAIPVFSRPNYSMALLLMLSEVALYRKSNRTDAKRESVNI